jgi:hypothetical protein
LFKYLFSDSFFSRS